MDMRELARVSVQNVWVRLYGREIEDLRKEISDLWRQRKLELSDGQLADLLIEIRPLIGWQSSFLRKFRPEHLFNEIADFILGLKPELNRDQLTDLLEKIADPVLELKPELNNDQLTDLLEKIGYLIVLRGLKSGDERPEDEGIVTNGTGLKAVDGRIVIKGKGLKVVPPEILNQEKLRKLDLRSNHLDVLPMDIGKLTALVELLLFNNRLTTLPPEIGQLTALNYVHLDHNRLTTLPSEIGQLRNLQRLCLRQNRIEALPAEIGKLSQLQSLFLPRNRLTALPPEIGNLKDLRELDLMDNQLEALPPEIRKLTNLKNLYLRGNDLLEIPPEVLAQFDKPAEILAYYFDRVDAARKANTRPLNEAKLVLVGQPKVGKTCIRKRLLSNVYDPEEPMTRGIDIDPWEPSDGQGIRLNVWDFGGQEIMHASHQFFLTERTL